MRIRTRTGVMAAAYAVAAMTLLTACVTQAGSQPVLSSTELAATWASHDGGLLTFANDHRFTATGLRLDKIGGGCAGSGKFSASGTWQFLNAQGDSGPNLTGYPKGSLIYLSFDPSPGNPASGCTAGGITLTSWNIGSTPGLCLQMDPDTQCDEYIFDKK